MQCTQEKEEVLIHCQEDSKGSDASTTHCFLLFLCCILDQPPLDQPHQSTLLLRVQPSLDPRTGEIKRLLSFFARLISLTLMLSSSFILSQKIGLPS